MKKGMAVDFLTEMLTGEKGAVRGIGKFIISPRTQKINKMPLILVAGAAVFPIGGTLVLPENKEYSEMWECEIIIIPKRKYSGKIDNQEFHAFSGSRIDQILCGRYGDPTLWGKEYFVEELKRRTHDTRT